VSDLIQSSKRSTRPAAGSRSGSGGTFIELLLMRDSDSCKRAAQYGNLSCCPKRMHRRQSRGNETDEPCRQQLNRPRPPHEQAQGDRLRGGDLRVPRLARLGLRRGRRQQVRPRPRPLSRRRAGMDADYTARRMGGPRQEPRIAGRRDAPDAASGLDEPARHPRSPAARDRDAGREGETLARPVQARPRDQPRDSGPLRAEPAPGAAAGAVFAPERKQHRSGAVPQRHPGRHGGTQDRLHAKCQRRHRPVPLRSRPEAEGKTSRAAPELARRRPRSLRCEQQPRLNGHAALRAVHGVPAVQQGRSRRRRGIQ